MTLSEHEAQKEREAKERRAFRLKEARDKIFPEDRKRKAPAEESESEAEAVETDEEQDHGKVPCDACRERKVACVWSGTGRIKACDRCRRFRKPCRVNGVGHRAPRVKKVRVGRDTEEEPGEQTTPVKAKSIPVAGNSGGGGVQVGNGVASGDASLRAPLVDMARNLRRVVSQNAELLEELNKSQNTHMDLLADLCRSLHEITFQLRQRNLLWEQVYCRNSSEVSESIQLVPKLVEHSESGVQVEIPEVTEDAENMEVTEDVGNDERAEKVGTGNAGVEDETMKEA
jgi:hypothetical protein